MPQPLPWCRESASICSIIPLVAAVTEEAVVALCQLNLDSGRSMSTAAVAFTQKLDDTVPLAYWGSRRTEMHPL